jgi:hypothetical protein
MFDSANLPLCPRYYITTRHIVTKKQRICGEQPHILTLGTRHTPQKFHYLTVHIPFK